MDELEAVGDPELRDALAFVRGSSRAITADELAAAQRVHRNVARSRLERLIEAGLLEAEYERRTGRTGPGAGRPAKTYAPAAELEAIEFPDRRTEALVGSIVDRLPARGRAAALHAAGVEFGQRLVSRARTRRSANVRAGLEAMCAAVRKSGFQVAVLDASAREATLVTPTCPLRPLVRERGDLADLDRGMWAGLAAQFTGVPVERVSCETHNCLADHGSCRVKVAFLKTIS